jgi:hypothetical protein
VYRLITSFESPLLIATTCSPLFRNCVYSFCR